MPTAMHNPISDVSTDEDATLAAASIRHKETTLYVSAYRNPKTNLYDVAYKFYRNEIIVGTTAVLVISVEPYKKGSTPIDGQLPDNEVDDISIFSYCCTETDLRKVSLLSRSPVKGDPASHVDVAQTYDDQKAPLSTARASTKEIALQFRLEERQLVFVGIIVKIIPPGGEAQYYLCDPQVGNGPPGSAGLLYSFAQPLIL